MSASRAYIFKTRLSFVPTAAALDRPGILSILDREIPGQICRDLWGNQRGFVKGLPLRVYIFCRGVNGESCSGIVRSL